MIALAGRSCREASGQFGIELFGWMKQSDDYASDVGEYQGNEDRQAHGCNAGLNVATTVPTDTVKGASAAYCQAVMFPRELQMKRFHPFLLLLLFPPVVLAQSQPDSVVADTLDWHRYYPLTLDNLWEYQVSEGEPLLRREIVGDTLAADQRYFLMEESSYDYDNIGGGTELELWTRDTLFVRYDSLGTVVTLRALEADTLAVPQTVSFEGGVYGYFDLRAAFGDTVYYGAGDEDFYWTRGGFNERLDVGGETVEVPALKNYQSWLWTESYAADIGFIGGGNLWGPRITYAKVGGIEYGKSRTPTAVEEGATVPEQFAIETIYPNPINDRATVVYRLPKPQSITIDVFNVLGQWIGGKEVSAHPAGFHSYDLNTSKWAGGTYLVRITTEGGQQSLQSVIVIR